MREPPATISKQADAPHAPPLPTTPADAASRKSATDTMSARVALAGRLLPSADLRLELS